MLDVAIHQAFQQMRISGDAPTLRQELFNNAEITPGKPLTS